MKVHAVSAVVDRGCVWALVFFASGATAFSRSFTTLADPLSFCVLALGVSLLLWIHRPTISRRLLFILSGFVVICLIQALQFQAFHYRFLLYFPLAFTITFIVVASLRLRFFTLYEELICSLALISLIFWGLILWNEPSVTNLLAQLTLFEPYNEIVSAHVLVYTIINEQVSSVLPRNSGFAWEPGAFAVFLSLAIFVNLVTRKFKLRGNWRLAVLVAALLSTQSTTGYSILLLLCLLWLINMRNKLGLALAAPVALLILLYVATLPFMFEKVSNLFAEDIDELAYISKQGWNRDRVIYAQRIASLEIDFYDFVANPVLGYGGHDEAMWTRKEGLNVVSISGIGKVFAKFGTVGAAFFFWALICSSMRMAKIFNYKGSLVFAVLVLQIAVSYSLIEVPLLMCFWLFAYFERRTSRIPGRCDPVSEVSSVHA